MRKALVALTAAAFALGTFGAIVPAKSAPPLTNLWNAYKVSCATKSLFAYRTHARSVAWQMVLKTRTSNASAVTSFATRWSMSAC